ncbi:MAG: DUF871 domain-containing protein [Mycoplasmoidaceae bacterium]
MLGISLYPEKTTKAEMINYINLAAKYDFKRVFTCLLSVKETKEKIKADFTEIIAAARNKGMEVILDIAPNIFEELGISYDDLSFFHELGATGVRLDVGFDGLKESQLTYNKQNLDIEINMSTGTKYLDNIISFVPNKKKLIGSHNFYPMKYSGLSFEHFMKCCKQFKEYGIRTAAFVSSQVADHGPWPIMDGLCTLEMHRDLPLATQVKHLKMIDELDDIIIANAYASEAELKEVSEITDLLQLNIVLNKDISETEKAIVLNEPHFNRGDVSDYLIRSTQSRLKYKDHDFPATFTPQLVKRGYITIGNNTFGQYKGELHLSKKDHDNYLLRKNVVARIINEELFLLDYIKPWSKFGFKLKKQS